MKNRFFSISLFIGSLVVVLFAGVFSASAQGICGAGQVFSDACERCISISFSEGGACASPTGGQFNSCGDCGCAGGQVNCSGTCGDNQSGDACDAGGGREGTLNSCGTTCSATPRPPVTLAPYGADTDATSVPSIWVNKTAGGNLVELQESGANRLVLEPNGNLRVIGRSATDGGDLYLNSGKAVRVDGSGATEINFGNFGGGAFRLNVNGTIQGDFVASDGSSCTAGQALQRSADGGRWECSRAGGIYEAGSNIDTAELGVNRIAVVGAPNFDQLTIGTAATPTTLASGENLISGMVSNDSAPENMVLLFQQERIRLRGGARLPPRDLLSLDTLGNLRVGEGLLTFSAIDSTLTIGGFARGVTQPGHLAVQGSIRGNFVASDTSTCAANQILQRSEDGLRWVCADSIGGDGAFDTLTVGGPTVDLGADAGGQMLISGSAPYASLAPSLVLGADGRPVIAVGGGVTPATPDSLLQLQTIGADGTTRAERFSVDRDGNLFIGGAASGNSLFSQLLTLGGGNLVLNSERALFVNNSAGAGRLRIANGFAAAEVGPFSQVRVDVLGELTALGRVGFGSFSTDDLLSSDSWVSMPSLFVGSADRLTGTRIGGTTAQGAGDISTSRRLTISGGYVNPTTTGGALDCPEGTLWVDVDNDSVDDSRECYRPPGAASSGHGIVGGDLIVTRSGAFGGHTPSSTASITTPNVYAGSGTRGTVIGALSDTSQYAGDILTDGFLKVGGTYENPASGACPSGTYHIDFSGDGRLDAGECYDAPDPSTPTGLLVGGSAAIQGPLRLGTSFEDDDSQSARWSTYLRIQNMDNDPGPDNPAEQYAIRVEDEDENEWFSVRRSGYAGLAPPDIIVNTAGRLEATVINSRGAINAVLGFFGPSASLTNQLNVGTSTTNLGVAAGGTALISGVANYANMHPADYLLRLQTASGSPASFTDRLLVNKDGQLQVYGGARISGGELYGTGNLRIEGNSILGNAATDTTTISGSLTVGGDEVANETGEIRLRELANEDFDTHTTASGAASSTNEGYFVIGLKSSQGTCDNACDKHGLLCDSAYRVGSSSLASGGTSGCGNTTENKFCWCKG